MRWIVGIVTMAVLGCGSSSKSPPDPNTTSTAASSATPPVDAALTIPVDATVVAPVEPAPMIREPPHKLPPGKRSPPPGSPPPPPRPAQPALAAGIHAVLVVIGEGLPAHAYVLACGHVVRGQPTKLLSGKACAAKLASNAQLEAILDTGRKPVKLVGRGLHYPCPGPGKRSDRQPFVKISGITEDEYRDGMIVVTKGLVDYDGPLDPDVEERITENNDQPESKTYGQGWPFGLQFDLDGDGAWEALDSSLGRTNLYRGKDGALIGFVGCYFG